MALGDDAWELGDLAGAARHYAAAVGRSAAFRTADPRFSTGLRQSGVGIEQRQGDAAAELGDWPAALELIAPRSTVDRGARPARAGNAELARDRGTDLARLGAAAMEAKRHAQALACTSRRGRAPRAAARRRAARRARARRCRRGPLRGRAQALTALDRRGEARPLVGTALARWRALVARDRRQRALARRARAGADRFGGLGARSRRSRDGRSSPRRGGGDAGERWPRRIPTSRPIARSWLGCGGSRRPARRAAAAGRGLDPRTLALIAAASHRSGSACRPRPNSGVVSAAP